MIHEAFPRRPEFFEDVQNIDQLIGGYNFLMHDLTQEHEVRLGTITAAYEQAFADETTQPGHTDIESLLAATPQAVDEAIYLHSSLAKEVIWAAAANVPRFLSQPDRQLLERAQSEAFYNGISVREVKDVLGRASSPQAQSAMRVALDATVLKQLESSVVRSGVDSRAVQKLLSEASGPAAQSAMRATLDPEILRQLQRAAGQSFEFKDTAKILETASSSAAQKALHCAFDTDVLSQLQTVVRMFGPRSSYVPAVLRQVSGATVSQVFADRVGAERIIFDEGSEETGGGPEKDEEVEGIVKAVIARNRTVGWLAGQDPKDIRRVINTVRSARARAAASGEELSDFEIFKRYRRKADEAEHSDEASKNPQISISYRIVDALMGGRKGNLPF